MFDKILVATDGSDHARKAVEIAADLAEKYQSQLTILTVYKTVRVPESSHSLVRTTLEQQPQHTDDQLKELGGQILSEASKICDQHDIPRVETMLKRGQPARTIANTAEELEAEAIVIGSRGLGDVSGLLLGAVSHKVATLATCTVITVK